MHQHLKTLLMVGALFAACSAVAAAENCLPKDLRLGQRGSSGASETAAPHGKAVAYLDRSESMKGFVQRQSSRRPTFNDAILGLRETLETVSPTVTFNRFGANIAPLANAELTAPTQPDFYLCNRMAKPSKAGKPNENTEGCESRIDKVLKAVAESSDDTVSLLVTDLFLSAKDLIGSEYGTMRSSLERVLLAGKSIGILGISAPFRGDVHDLPGPQPTYRHEGDRPFFLVMIGNDIWQLLRLKKAFEARLLSAAPAERQRFALYTLHPAHPATAAVPLPLDANEAARPGRGLSVGSKTLPVVVLGEGAIAPRSRGAIADLQLPFTAPLADFKVTESMWISNTDAPCSSDWSPWRKPALIAAKASAGDLVLSLDGLPRLLLQLPKDKTFLLRATVDAVATGKSPTLTGWLQDWSFEERQTATLLKEMEDKKKKAGQASGPQFFPVLNLAQLADSLDRIINSDFKPVTVADYLFAFQKKGN